MLKLYRQALLVAGMVAFPSVVMADDVAAAAKLVGNWEGKWQYEAMGGKLTVKITASSGNTLKGESKWFGTAVGDFSDRFSKAKLKDRKLEVVEQTMDFEVTVSEDGESMEGTWTSPIAKGPMTLKKLAN